MIPEAYGKLCVIKISQLKQKAGPGLANYFSKIFACETEPRDYEINGSYKIMYDVIHHIVSLLHGVFRAEIDMIILSIRIIILCRSFQITVVMKDQSSKKGRNKGSKKQAAIQFS